VCKDWDVIKPEHILDRVEVRRGDIVIIHTGFHRYCQGQPQQDLRLSSSARQAVSARLLSGLNPQQL
jgi:kynurenine formamidase